MQDFAVVGDFLKAKFDKARLVEMNQEATGLSPLTKTDRQIRKSDIVFMENSPDYCTYNPSIGKYVYVCDLCMPTTLYLKTGFFTDLCESPIYTTSPVLKTLDTIWYKTISNESGEFLLRL